MNELNEQGPAFRHEGEPLSRFRTFGHFGPAYEVVSIRGGVAHIKVVESGEELDYPMPRLLDDPEA
jgi:hypothetical protein